MNYFKFNHLYNIFKFRVQAEIKESKILFIWFFIEPLAFIMLFYFIFGSLQGNSENFLTFIIIGKFSLIIFVKYLFSTARILRAWKNNIKNNDVLIINYYAIHFFHITMKFIPIIFVLYVYILFIKPLGLSDFINICIIILNTILLAFLFGVLFSIIYIYYPQMDILFSILPLLLLFCSGVFFDLNDIKDELIKQILFLNPLAVIINDLRQIILDNLNNFNFMFKHYLIFFLSTLLNFITIKYLVQTKKNMNQISLNLP